MIPCVGNQTSYPFSKRNGLVSYGQVGWPSTGISAFPFKRHAGGVGKGSYAKVGFESMPCLATWGGSSFSVDLAKLKVSGRQNLGSGMLHPTSAFVNPFAAFRESCALRSFCFAEHIRPRNPFPELARTSQQATPCSTSACRGPFRERDSSRPFREAFAAL